MTIVHALGWYFPESVGGTEVYVSALCRRQQATGHSVSVVAPDAAASDVREYVHDGVRVFRYPIPDRPTRAEAQAEVAVRGSDRLRQFIGAERPDVFHVHSIVTGLGRYELAAARAAGSATVVTHHLPGLGHLCRRGTLLELGTRPCDGLVDPIRCSACVLTDRGMPRALARRAASLPRAVARVGQVLPGRTGTTLGLRRSIERDQEHQRELNQNCDAIVVLNEAARRILLANGAPASRVVLNRLGHDRRTLPPRARATTRAPVRIGFLGRLHPTKGVYELVRAARSVSSDVEFDLELRGITSSDVERLVLADLRAIAGSDPRIRFGTAVPPDAVAGVLAGFDVLCCPSTWFENGPTVAIEAIAVGTAVIGTRLGNLAELVGDGVTGRLVAPADEPALKAALVEVSTNPDIVNRWRSRLTPARTMDDVAVDYERLYAQLLGTGRLTAAR